MSIILIINILVSAVLVYFTYKFFTQNKEKVEGVKADFKKMFKVILAIPLLIIISSLLFVLSGFVKDTFFLGPEPNLSGKSILFEAEGEGVQLFWRHYKENNEYTEEYLFDKPVEGILSDVLLRNDEVWFIVRYIRPITSQRNIYIYKFFENELEEISLLKDKDGGRYLLRLDDANKLWLVEREKDYEKDRIFNTTTMFFEQNYFNTSNNKLSTDTGDVPCPQSFGGFGLPCFVGYLKTDKLIRNSDNVTLFKVRELVTPLGVAMLGKRFSRLTYSKDQQYAFQFTYNAESRKSTTYLVHINSGKIMKISKGDVPVLMP